MPLGATPDEFRAGAIVFTDFWAAYAAVIPEAQHTRRGKGAGKTCHVERFWCTLRRRCARYVRKALSFSKCPRNHVGAPRYFIRRYNLCRLRGHYHYFLWQLPGLPTGARSCRLSPKTVTTAAGAA